MDKDIVSWYAAFSGFIGFLFGIETGVLFCAIAGSFLALRYCATCSTMGRLKDVLISSLFTCLIVGNTLKLHPPWLSPKIVAIIMGFLFLLIAEKLYKTARDFKSSEKFNTFIDKWIEKWTP